MLNSAPRFRAHLIGALLSIMLSPLIFPDTSEASLPGMAAPPPKIYQSPDSLIAFQVPAGWNVVQVDGSKKTTLAPNKTTGDAKILIERIEVPQGAHPRQLRLRAIEALRTKLSGFQSHGERDILISGKPAAVVTATYPWQGNIQYPRAIEQVFVVSGSHALRIHFECFQPQAAQYAAAVALLYQSLSIRTSPSTSAAKP